MGVYITRRVLSAIPTLLVVACVGFMLVHLTPGDPVLLMLGEDASAEQVQSLRNELGLDDPLGTQFARWALRLIRLDLGNSLRLGLPVSGLIASRVEPTVVIAILALAFSVLVGVLAGVAAAVRQGTVMDQIIIAIMAVGASIPTFWLGMQLILLVGVKLRWAPVAGYEPLSLGLLSTLRFVFVPALALGLREMALVARMTRNTMLEVMRTDYVRTAKAKGLGASTVMYKHALRNCLIPIITVIGLSIARLLAGSVVIEDLFGIPGVGRLAVTAIRRRDYPIIQGVIILVGVLYMTVNLLVDLSYMIIDPRIRYS